MLHLSGNSHHQDYYNSFRLGDTNLNLHLPLLPVRGTAQIIDTVHPFEREAFKDEDCTCKDFAAFLKPVGVFF